MEARKNPNKSSISAQERNTGATFDPQDNDLIAIMKAWPDLPPALKAGIVAMVKAAKQLSKGEQL
ncbi:MAG: hypothetical protein WCI73_20805 [Phycisphaerae bacterium]